MKRRERVIRVTTLVGLAGKLWQRGSAAKGKTVSVSLVLSVLGFGALIRGGLSWPTGAVAVASASAPIPERGERLTVHMQRDSTDTSAGKTPTPATAKQAGELAGSLPVEQPTPGATKITTPSVLEQDGKPITHSVAGYPVDPDEPSASWSLERGVKPIDDLLPARPERDTGQTPTPTVLGRGGELVDDSALSDLNLEIIKLGKSPIVAQETLMPDRLPPLAASAPPPRREVITYTVQKGDNVRDIARRYGISSDTLIWANDRLEADPDLLSIGQELIIPPVSGVLHTVEGGDTLKSIAKRYGVSLQAIVMYAPNRLQEPDKLTPGQRIMVPDGKKPFVPRQVQSTQNPVTTDAQTEAGRFIWPANGHLTQYFSQRHPAIDLANTEGTPLSAADGGQVTFAGWAGGLGNAVFIDHGDGYVTWYGHMESYAVKKGQQVERGQVIGKLGNTGNSTGPHVHLVIRYEGVAVNPIRYLPPVTP